ncbi:MAG: glycosyltransferase family 4 protein [Opitutales bacterium]|nr:glycosyltransferase family 4 protein [Opitutales bacterium]
MIRLIHPTGNANVRAVADALARHQLLEQFHTCLADGVGVSGKVLRKLAPDTSARRRFDLPTECIRTHPLRELTRQLAPRLKLPALTRHETGWASVDAIYHALDRTAAKGLDASGLRGVYAYEDGALATFTAARKRGLLCAYDLPIAYWRLGRQIQSEEAELQPEWAGTLDAMRDSPEKLERKDRELAAANIVFCASTFTQRSLELYPGGLDKPVIQITYGAPPLPPTENRTPNTEHRTPRSPLRVLFVGGLSQRKGLSYLFEAVGQAHKAIELTIIGRRPGRTCAALEAALAQHRHIDTLPHSGVLEEMARADVFVFPSLFEGFGLVLLEAMSRGLPCITTPHTAGPDIITDGRDGYIVPIRDAAAIASRLEYLHADRDALGALGLAAQATANRLSWEAYGDATAAALVEHLDGQKMHQ